MKPTRRDLPKLQHSLPTATGAPLIIDVPQVLSDSQAGEITIEHNAEAKGYEIRFNDDAGNSFGFRNDSDGLKAYFFNNNLDDYFLGKWGYGYGTYSIKRENGNWVYYLNGSRFSFPVANNNPVSVTVSLFGTGSNIQGLSINKKEVQNYEVFTRVSTSLHHSEAEYVPVVTLTEYRRVIGSTGPYQLRRSSQMGERLSQTELKSGINLDYQHSRTNRYISVNGELQQSETSWTDEETVTENSHFPNRGYLGNRESDNNNQVKGLPMEMCYYKFSIGHALNPQSTKYEYSFDQEGQPIVDNNGAEIELDNGVTQILGPCMPDQDQDGIYDLYEVTQSQNTQDTDRDGIPNHEDNDDDGDGILTQDEGADPDQDGNPSDARNSNPFTDGSNPYHIGNALPDYLDDDDDGDGYATWETAEGGKGYKHAPAGYSYLKDTDADTIPDFLDYQDVIYPENKTLKQDNYVNLVGDKRYELSNHLGNVLAVISDRNLPSSSLTYFKPDVLSYSDYYPFGMLVPNRHGTSDSYRYGFQGQEKDDELKGEGNSLNYTFRMHDPRVGRFFAVDPLFREYPYLTPYQFSSNQPIHAQELEGLESSAEIKPTATANLTVNIDSKGKFGFKTGVNLGLTVKEGDVMGSVGISASAFNIGLGSNHMSTGNHNTQYNITGSIGATIGYGTGNELPLNTFTKKTDSGMMNGYKSSITFGQNITFNSEGNNQRVSSIGFKAGNFSLNTYNDMIGNGYFGDGEDRFDSGGGNISIFGNSGTFTFGTNVFTGDRLKAKPGQNSMFGFGLSGSNPTGGAFGTYSQSPRGQSQTSGMTYYNFRSVLGHTSSAEIHGKSQMWSQDAIHLYLVGNPLFYSTANDVYLNPNK